jgi:hypothetical protein
MRSRTPASASVKWSSEVSGGVWSLADEAASCGPTIGEAIERALARSTSGITRTDLPSAASEAAGRELKAISVMGQLPQLRDQGRIVQDGDRWRLPAVDAQAMRLTLLMP